MASFFTVHSLTIIFHESTLPISKFKISCDAKKQNPITLFLII